MKLSILNDSNNLNTLKANTIKQFSCFLTELQGLHSLWSTKLILLYIKNPVATGQVKFEKEEEGYYSWFLLQMKPFQISIELMFARTFCYLLYNIQRIRSITRKYFSKLRRMSGFAAGISQLLLAVIRNVGVWCVYNNTSIVCSPILKVECLLVWNCRWA